MDSPTLKLPPASMQAFIDDELLRVPVWMNQLLAQLRNNLPSCASPAQRSAAVDTLAAAQHTRERLIQTMTQQLRHQLSALGAAADVAAPMDATGTAKRGLRAGLGLVEDEAVAVDVVIAQAVEQINSAAEHELRELQTFTAALAGDMDFTCDHNPFTPSMVVRALWAATQELSHLRPLRLAFMRLAAAPLAQVLRRSYAAASSRLEAQGVHPAAYRTLVLPGGGRLSRRTEITFSPELQRVLEALPTGLGQTQTLRYEGQDAGGTNAARALPAHVAEPSLQAQQTLELVRRLFAAMAKDRRIPADVQALLARLLAPVLSLAQFDATLLDRDRHPLWRFINTFVFAAEVTPAPADPERKQLLRMAKDLIAQINAQERPASALFAGALEQLQGLTRKRMQRRQQAAASQTAALLKLERDLTSGRAPDPGAPLALDSQQMDTVPAALLDRDDMEPDADTETDDEAQAWLQSLTPGHWVRMFLQGQWVRAQLLWMGPQRQVWLFADGASDATWALRRSALTMMRGTALIKTLQLRSIVRSAAARVYAQTQERETAQAA